MAYVTNDINLGINQKVFLLSGQKLQVKVVLNDNCINNGLETVIIYNINLGDPDSIFTIDTTGTLPVVAYVALTNAPEISFFTDLSRFCTGSEMARDSIP